MLVSPQRRKGRKVKQPWEETEANDGWAFVPILGELGALARNPLRSLGLSRKKIFYSNTKITFSQTK
jgi:hypothetical protein